jgi:hypothetical protein
MRRPGRRQARHSGSARILSQVARVSADSGLIVALPHNLYQIARRTLPVRSGRSPARRTARTGGPTRSLVSPPSGSPMISLSACLTTTGWARSGCTRRGRRSRRLDRAGSARRCAVGIDRVSGSPSTNHQGTPLSIGTMIVSGPISGRSFGRRGSAGALTAMISTSRPSELRQLPDLDGVRAALLQRSLVRPPVERTHPPIAPAPSAMHHSLSQIMSPPTVVGRGTAGFAATQPSDRAV